MSTNTPAAAESALLIARHRLAALGVPADDLPDDLVPVASGGSLMPSLPGWTPARARDWAAVAARWPAIARRVVAWCDENAGRLANLHEVRVLEPDTPPPCLYLDLIGGPQCAFTERRHHVRGTVDPRGVERGLCPVEEWAAGRVVEYELEARLGTLNRLGRPWHAELAAAVAAARRGEVRPDTLVTVAAAHGSYAYGLTVSTRLRVLGEAVATHLMAHLSRTNAGPFCGAGPGELLLEELRTDAMEDGSASLSYRFAFRPGLPWSRRLRLDGGYAEALDPAGSPAYEPADFFELP